MSPVEVMCFFFLTLAVIKAVKDSFEYWGRGAQEDIPHRGANVSSARAATARKARVSAISREHVQTRRRSA